MVWSNVVEEFTGQISQIQEAIRSILKSDSPIGRAAETLDTSTAAAITESFTLHVPNFAYDEQCNTQDGKFKVDSAIKEVCLELVRAAQSQRQPVMRYCMEGAISPSIPQLLDLARYLSQILLADQILFLILIGDLVETCTVDSGGDIFLYLESCIPFMVSKFNFETQSAAPKLQILRICNMLLRRLSRAENHVLLAGRIHIFLSQILPSTDRSAVNASGMVNESNSLEVEDVPEGLLDTEGQPVNADFYKQLWSLQQYFQNPTKAADPNLWLQVHAGIKSALAEFAKVRITVASGGINSGNASAGNQEALTVKYLSSPRLLTLQLQDSGFRRHFIMQCLILLQACSVKSLNRQEVFRIKQQGEADELQDLLYRDLEKTPSYGLQYTRAVKALMHHEDRWAEWKADGAKSFEKPKRPLQDAPPATAKRQKLSSSIAELKRLWTTSSDNLSHIDIEQRTKLPTLREFLDPVLQEMDPEEGIEEQYKRKQDAAYRWESLRQISKASRVNLALVVKAQKPNLEDAARLLFPEEAPAGDSQSLVTLPEISELGAPPSPGPAPISDMTVDVSVGAEPELTDIRPEAEAKTGASVEESKDDVQMGEVTAASTEASDHAESLKPAAPGGENLVWKLEAEQEPEKKLSSGADHKIEEDLKQSDGEVASSETEGLAVDPSEEA